MLFAAINWLSISINLLLVVFVIVCLLMSLLVLMQRPKQEGLGAAFGGGVTDQVFGARTTNVLQKGTVYLGSLFFILSLALAILIGKQTQQRSLLEPKTSAAELIVPPAGVPMGVPPVEEPLADQRSLADELPAETETPVEVSEPVPAEVAPAPVEDTAPAPADNVEPAPAAGETTPEATPEATPETTPETAVEEEPMNQPE